MADIVSRLKDVAKILMGVSAYNMAPANGPNLGDKQVESIRESQGGQLSPMPVTQTRWYLSDLESAQFLADSGNLEQAARLARAMRRDGQFVGLMSTLTTGVVSLPRKFYGEEEQCAALDARNGSRSTFDDMFPPSELALLAHDGDVLGVAAAELVPVPGREEPIMIRLEPEFLRYRWNENRWYYSSIAGQIPITPGDGRWILHTPGGRVSPWLSGKWYAGGRAYINKEHALLSRSNYISKLANPARAAIAPPGSNHKEKTGLVSALIAWGLNTVFELPPGWDVKLIETKGEGYQVFQAAVDSSDRELAVVIAGQVVTVDGGAGFSNSDIHRLIRGDIITSVAGSLAYTLNTQGIPPWIARTYGPDAIAGGAIVEWDARRPKDLAAEAQSMLGVANAITALSQALAPHGRELDIEAILTRFAIPTKSASVKPLPTVTEAQEQRARMRLIASPLRRETENARDRSVYREAA